MSARPGIIPFFMREGISNERYVVFENKGIMVTFTDFDGQDQSDSRV